MWNEKALNFWQIIFNIKLKDNIKKKAIISLDVEKLFKKNYVILLECKK
jgi:hypothetical protein